MPVGAWEKTDEFRKKKIINVKEFRCTSSYERKPSLRTWSMRGAGRSELTQCGITTINPCRW